jgi:hypothetical protein
MGLPQATMEWILTMLINLLVPGVVWATVIAGLILVVRDRVEEDDVIKHLTRQTDRSLDRGECSLGIDRPGTTHLGS